MVNLIGFNGPTPHSVIVWQMNGQALSKTTCYSAVEEQEALNRFNTPGDFYNGYDLASVIGENDLVTEYSHMEAVSA